MDPYQIQDIIGLFYRTINSVGGKTLHQPKGTEIARWIDIHGYDATERGIVKIKNFVLTKVTDKRIRTDEEADYMVNYLGVCIAKAAEEPEKEKRYEPATQCLPEDRAA